MDLLLALDPQGAVPLYEQVVRELRQAIVSGKLAPGTRLPSSREMAAIHAISRNTVATAYDQLVAEGYIEGRERSGHYVSRDLPDARLQAERHPGDGTGAAAGLRLSGWAGQLAQLGLSSPRDLDLLPFDFRQHVSERVFPREEWRRHMLRALADEAYDLLEYDAPAGYRPLREAIAGYASRSRGMVCSPEQVIVTTGSRQGMDLLLRALCDPGDAVALEEPGYQGARQALLAAGARILPVPVDEQGLQVERLEALPDVRLVYVTPSNQYPTGVTLDLRRRLALLDWARATCALVIEDDYDGDFRYEGRPLQALQGLDGSRVCYIGTFAKSLAPGLRLGFLVVPPELVETIALTKWLTDRQTAALSQAALASFIAEGGLERHLRRARLVFRRQRDALLAALRDCLPGAHVLHAAPPAGMHVPVVLPGIASAAAEADLIGRARAVGIGLQSARVTYAADPQSGLFLLWFSHLDEDALREGIRRLAGLLRQ